MTGGAIVVLPASAHLSQPFFEAADVEKTWKHFELYEAECKALIGEYGRLTENQGSDAAAPEDGATSVGRPGLSSRFPLLAAYDLCLKCSHLFNILDARGAISVTERVGVIARVRALAVGIAKAWVDQQKEEAADGDAAESTTAPERKAKETLAPVAT